MSQCGNSSAKLLQSCSRIRQRRPTTNSLLLSISATRAFDCSSIEIAPLSSRNVRNFSTDRDQHHHWQDLSDVLKGSEPKASLSFLDASNNCNSSSSHTSNALPKLNDHIDTMNILRESTSQQVHAIIKQQSASLRDTWVRKKKKLQWELEHPESRDRTAHATHMGPLGMKEDSSKQMKWAPLQESPSLMDFLESTPNTRQSLDGASQQSQHAYSMQRSSIPSEKKNPSLTPSLLDLLDAPVTDVPLGTFSLQDRLADPVVPSRMSRAEEHMMQTQNRHGENHTLSLMDMLEAPMPSIEEITLRKEIPNAPYWSASTGPIRTPGAPADSLQSSAPSLMDLLNSQAASSHEKVPSLMDLGKDEPMVQSTRASFASNHYSATTSLMDLLDQPKRLLGEATRHTSPHPTPQNELHRPFADPLNYPTLDDMTQPGPSLMDLLTKEQPSATESPEKPPSLMDLLNASSSTTTIPQSTHETSRLSVKSETAGDGITIQPSLMDLLESSSSERSASREAPTFHSTALQRQLSTNAVVAECLALLSVMGGAGWTTSDQRGYNRFIQSDQDIEKSELLIQDVLDGTIALSTEDSNMLMLHIGTSTMYKSDDAIQKMKELHKILTQHGIADSWTHYILLVTCSQRSPGLSMANDIIESLAFGSSCQWTDRLIIEAMVCLEQHGSISSAEKLLRKLESDSIHIPAEASISMIRLYQTENMQTAAMTIVNKYVEVSNYILSQHVRFGPNLLRTP